MKRRITESYDRQNWTRVVAANWGGAPSTGSVSAAISMIRAERVLGAPGRGEEFWQGNLGQGN